MLTDIEIAKSVKLRPINEVAAELGIHEDQVENYGRTSLRYYGQDRHQQV